MEKATAQLREWKDKLEAFNSKVPQTQRRGTRGDHTGQDDGSATHVGELRAKKKLSRKK
jgi:hypothetical protein